MSISALRAAIAAFTHSPIGVAIAAASVAAASVAAGAAAPAALGAQSERALVAWNALMLTPIGALPPLAPDVLSRAGAAAPLTVALQYGTWRYNVDDVAHYNAGLTVARRLGSGSTQVLATGMVITPPCSSCSSWAAGSLEVRSTLLRGALRRDAGTDPDGRASGALGVRVAAAAARYQGTTYAAARSAAAALAIGGKLRVTRGIRLTAAVLPGLGFGSLTSEDEVGRGLRTTFGTTFGAELGRHVAVDASTQRIYLAGGPTQMGLAVAWRPR